MHRYGGGRSVGVELDATRHVAALRLRDYGLSNDLITAEESDRIFLRNGDAFAPGAFSDATHIYMLSTCFGPHIFARFLGAISSAKTPRLGWVVSSRKIPDRLLDKHNAGETVRCNGASTVSPPVPICPCDQNESNELPLHLNGCC